MKPTACAAAAATFGCFFFLSFFLSLVSDLEGGKRENVEEKKENRCVLRSNECLASFCSSNSSPGRFLFQLLYLFFPFLLSHTLQTVDRQRQCSSIAHCRMCQLVRQFPSLSLSPLRRLFDSLKISLVTEPKQMKSEVAHTCEKRRPFPRTRNERFQREKKNDV